MAEVTIVGAGLAGTALAWALVRRGRTVRLIDREPPTTASRVAAGLLTPITGKKPAVSWRWAELRPTAERFYRAVEAATGERFFHDRPVLRLFTSDAERELFRNPAFAGLVQVTEEGGLMPSAAQLDTVAYLDASRGWFRQRGMYERGEWDGGVDGVTVLCQGSRCDPHPYFPLWFRLAKGEVLTVRIPARTEQRVVNRRGWWLAPTDTSGVYRFGATYSWGDYHPVPTPDGLAALEVRLNELNPGEYTVTDHVAGIRPILPGQKPVLGMHPTIPNLGVINGLGSKGALTAPFFAEQFAAHLCDGTPIDVEVDVRNRVDFSP